MHLKLSNSAGSSSNIKSDGNLLLFALTALFKYFVSTPYKRAKSLSSITCWPRITWMRLSIGNNGELFPPLTGSSIFSFSFIKVDILIANIIKPIGKPAIYSVIHLLILHFDLKSSGIFSSATALGKDESKQALKSGTSEPVSYRFVSARWRFKILEPKNGGH